MDTTPLEPNRPDVIDENFDGEAVIVHLMAGTYYSLSPAATILWQLLADGRSAASLAASVDAEAAVIGDFVERLKSEDLVRQTAADTGPASTRLVLSGPPTLERFTDMQDLLTLDPIHDIDIEPGSDGWPVARKP